MRKWIGLFVCLLLFIPPFLLQWTHAIAFLGQMLVGIWAVYHWILDLPARKQVLLTEVLLGVALAVTTLWTASLVWSLSYRSRTLGIDAQMGSVWIIKFLGDAEKAEAVASSFFASRGPGLVAPSMWNQRKQRLGWWAVPVNLVFSLHIPRGWQQPTYVGAHPAIWFDVPLWTVVALCLVPLAGIHVTRIWRRSWQRFFTNRKGRCRQCGYDLTANASGKCPECGTPIPEVVRKELEAREAKAKTTP